MSRLRVDPYIVALLLTVAVASLLPASGAVATGFGHATTIAIGLLFFLYGARLSTREAIDGLKHWRLHGLVSWPRLCCFRRWACCVGCWCRGRCPRSCGPG